MARLFLKKNFRKGGANLRVCHESPQGFATFWEISFEKRSIRAAFGFNDHSAVVLSGTAAAGCGAAWLKSAGGTPWAFSEKYFASGSSFRQEA